MTDLERLVRPPSGFDSRHRDMLTLDEDDYEALGFGDQLQTLASSGWAERMQDYDRRACATYRTTPRGKLNARARQLRWLKTEKGRAYEASYRKSDKYKTILAKASAKYRSTEAGRAKKAEIQRRYAARKKALQ